MTFKGILCATQAGFLAALASISAKLATSSVATTIIVTALLEQINIICSLDIRMHAEEVTVCLRLLAVAGIFLFNAAMWVLFTKSMHLCSSTVEATAFNASSNFLFTAIAGKLLFDEQLSLQWCLGSVFMVLGLVVLHKGGLIDAPDEEKHKTS